MGKKSFNTLFSRMLSTYLAIILLIIFLLGITISGMFKSQYMTENENELRREAAEINRVIVTQYVDAEKRAVAKDTLRTTMRKYDAMLQLYFIDSAFGKVILRDELNEAKWDPLCDADLSADASAIIMGNGEIEISSDRFTSGNIPIMTLSRQITTTEGEVIGAMFFHTDVSRTNDSIRKVYLDVLLSACIAVILAILAVTYITSRMTKPIVDMNNAINRFSRGEYEARVNITSHDEVGQLGQSFNEMANEINALEQSRRSFVANVSHELKTPLHSIMGCSELMENGLVKAEDMPRFVSRIHSEASRLVTLVDDIIGLSQLDENAEFPKEEVDLLALAEEEVGALAATAKDKDIKISVGGEEITVTGVRRLLHEIVYNLCDNALRYTEAGGKVGVTVGKEENEAVITVSDTGIGIPPEDLDRVFERFYRTDKSRSKETGGAGLGLSIVKHAVSYLGGRISLDSAQGIGTTFKVYLPKDPEDHSDD